MNSEQSTSGFIAPEDNEVLSGFTEREEIPSAGFNVLVRAKRYGRWWVLKGLKEEFRGDALYEELLRKEFEILISMQHPGVVAGVGLERVEGLGLCVVMEWVDGLSLKEWLRSPHSAQERWRVAWQLVEALEYIHGKQTAHRDLKPSNILITRNGQYVKLIDFGLSDTDNYTIFKQPAGSVGYLSPEQALGGKSDVRNDIYSLGCVLADLQLGVKARRVVRKCKADVDRRYSRVSEVRKALTACSRLGWQIGTVVMILACIGGGFWLGNSTQNSAAQEYMQSEMAKTEKLSDAVAEGCRRLDKVVDHSGWQEVNDFGEYGQLYSKVVGEMTAVFENYSQELELTYTQADRAKVVQEVGFYYNELYKPMYKKYIYLQEVYQKK